MLMYFIEADTVGKKYSLYCEKEKSKDIFMKKICMNIFPNNYDTRHSNLFTHVVMVPSHVIRLF